MLQNNYNNAVDAYLYFYAIDTKIIDEIYLYFYSVNNYKFTIF